MQKHSVSDRPRENIALLDEPSIVFSNLPKSESFGGTADEVFGQLGTAFVLLYP
jgi:hypothetical protein